MQKGQTKRRDHSSNEGSNGRGYECQNNFTWRKSSKFTGYTLLNDMNIYTYE